MPFVELSVDCYLAEVIEKFILDYFDNSDKFGIC